MEMWKQMENLSTYQTNLMGKCLNIQNILILFDYIQTGVKLDLIKMNNNALCFVGGHGHIFYSFPRVFALKVFNTVPLYCVTLKINTLKKCTSLIYVDPMTCPYNNNLKSFPRGQYLVGEKKKSSTTVDLNMFLRR